MLRTTIQPGISTPIRSVPDSIARPEYVWKPRPAKSTDPWVQSDEIIEKMRLASRLAARAMAAAGSAVSPGVTTDTLDKIGDIVNIDVTAYINGVHGDTNATYLSGNVSEEHRLLVDRTEESLRRAIKAVAPGRRLNVIGRVIESYAKRFDYGVVRDYTGHGIGRTFHSGLVVLHYDEPSVTTVLEKGMTFTIEPMITLGGIDWDQWDDGWTVTTKDKSWTAQFEHTLVVTDTGAEILTLP
jgi:methionyl aminopeptidase